MVDQETRAQMERPASNAHLVVSDPHKGNGVLRLDQEKVAIGRNRVSGIRVGGWFAPGKIAEIEEDVGGYNLTSHNAKRVSLNGKLFKGVHYLVDGDRLRFSSTAVAFKES